MANNLFALLIDGDNAHVKHIPHIWKKLSSYGEARIAKVFLIKTSIDQWLPIRSTYSIEPILVPNNSKSKNSVDIALVIDAMDLLHLRPEITGFCIVSSDGDYTRLAERLRTENKTVLGMGKKNTPPTFRVACSQFIDVDTLVKPAPAKKPAAKQPAANPAKAKKSSKDFDRMREAYVSAADDSNANGTDGWVSLAVMGTALRKLFPGHEYLVYQGVKHSQLKKVVETMMADYPNVIELSQKNKHAHLRMKR